MEIKTLYWILLSLFLAGCMINDETYDYQEKLVVWAHLQANMPMIDTVFVSRSAEISESTPAESLWVSDAEVRVIGDTIDLLLSAVPGIPGRYVMGSDHIFISGETYTISVTHNGESVSGTTTIPEEISIESTHPSVYYCRGQEYDVPSINIDNFVIDMNNPFGFRITGAIDTVALRQGNCFTESFASYPLYKIDFNEDDYQTIRIISFALEADLMDLEPFNDINANGFWDAGEEFEDWNNSGLRDSVYINLIYDTTGTYARWKGGYFRDENNVPYKLNPWPWNVETAPVSMSWLFYDYYGLHLMTFQATDEAFFNYFQGLPEFNSFVLPSSNIDGGYGLVSSSASRSFLVSIDRFEE